MLVGLLVPASWAISQHSHNIKDGFLHSVGSWASWHLWRRRMGEVLWTCFPSTACGLPEGSEGIEGFASVGHQKFGLIFVRYGYRGHRLAFFFFLVTVHDVGEVRS